MTPKPKPKEEPVPINFRISPKEKEAWQNHAKKLGMPLATFLKREINKIVFENLINYEEIIKSLLQFNIEITSAIVFIEQTKIAYKTENWRFIPELNQFLEMWGKSVDTSNAQFSKISQDITRNGLRLDGVKFSIFIVTLD